MTLFGWLKRGLKRRHQSPTSYRGPGGSQQSIGNYKPNSISVAIHSLTKSNEAANYRQGIQEERKFKWDRVTAIGVCIYTFLTIPIVVLSYFSARYSYESAIQARRQANAAERSLNRARLLFEPASSAPVYVLDKPSTYAGNQEFFTYTVAFRIANYGQVPATIVDVKANLYVILSLNDAGPTFDQAGTISSRFKNLSGDSAIDSDLRNRTVETGATNAVTASKVETFSTTRVLPSYWDRIGLEAKYLLIKVRYYDSGDYVRETASLFRVQSYRSATIVPGKYTYQGRTEEDSQGD